MTHLFPSDSTTLLHVIRLTATRLMTLKNLLPQNSKCKIIISCAYAFYTIFIKIRREKYIIKKLLQKFVSHLKGDGFILHMSSYTGNSPPIKLLLL